MDTTIRTPDAGDTPGTRRSPADRPRRPDMYLPTRRASGPDGRVGSPTDSNLDREDRLSNGR
jgi:hypothetical protein